MFTLYVLFSVEDIAPTNAFTYSLTHPFFFSFSFQKRRRRYVSTTIVAHAASAITNYECGDDQRVVATAFSHFRVSRHAVVLQKIAHIRAILLGRRDRVTWTWANETVVVVVQRRYDAVDRLIVLFRKRLGTLVSIKEECLCISECRVDGSVRARAAATYAELRGDPRACEEHALVPFNRLYNCRTHRDATGPERCCTGEVRRARRRPQIQVIPKGAFFRAASRCRARARPASVAGTAGAHWFSGARRWNRCRHIGRGERTPANRGVERQEHVAREAKRVARPVNRPREDSVFDVVGSECAVGVSACAHRSRGGGEACRGQLVYPRAPRQCSTGTRPALCSTEKRLPETAAGAYRDRSRKINTRRRLGRVVRIEDAIHQQNKSAKSVLRGAIGGVQRR